MADFQNGAVGQSAQPRVGEECTGGKGLALVLHRGTPGRIAREKALRQERATTRSVVCAYVCAYA